MNPGYYLVGYDRRTELAVEFHALPPSAFRDAMDVALLSPEVAKLAGDWSLSKQAAHRIAALTGAIVDTEQMDYCLEPYAPLATVAVRLGVPVGIVPTG